MKLGKLHIHWKCRCCKDEYFLREAYKKIEDLEKELMAPRNLTDAHDAEVINRWLEENVRDELEALSEGLDRRWRPLDK